jgi:hypothetical protein
MALRGVALGLVAAAMLAGCAASTPKPAVTAPPVKVPPDASYDWHVLLLAPFGSVLQDIPLTMHEVLLFHEAKNDSAADDAECFAVDTTPPRFVDRLPDEYTLCFKHDRLARIDVMVRLPLAQSAEIFADACRVWTKQPHPPSANLCEGFDGTVAFSSRLEDDPEHADALMTVDLVAPDRPPDPKPER